MRIDSFFIRSFENDIMSITVGADGAPWRMVELPISDLQDKSFWDKLKDATEKAEINESERGEYKCPTCGQHKATFLRQYKRKAFCGFCGSHLRITKTGLELICARA